MLFHMLRTMAGNDGFNNSIRQFWQRYQFKYASFTDVIEQLYPASDNNDHDNNNGYRSFIEQWLNRTGAPEISLDKVSVDKLNDDYLLTIKISQQQHGPAYQMQIPLEVTLQGKTQTVREKLFLTEKNNLITLKYKQKPLAVTLDPDYDVFRLLHANERPASLGRLFGAKKQLLVMPAKATAEQIKAWQRLAATWSSLYNNVELIYDNELDKEMKAVADGTAVWLLGWNNELLKNLQEIFTSQDLASTSATFSSALSPALSAHTVTIDGQQLHADKHALVLLDADNSRTPLGFIGADDPEVIALLARKLPHYSSYAVLAFELPEVKNSIKQHLPVLKSPMVWKPGHL